MIEAECSNGGWSPPRFGSNGTRTRGTLNHGTLTHMALGILND